MVTKIYGISNCGSVKKARQWLTEQQLNYQFIDLKKTPPTRNLIENWLTEIPLETLLNKRGTTWRKLTQEQKEAVADHQLAIQLMLEQPSIIKRPVLEQDGHFYAGFNEAAYKTIFHK